VTKPAVVTALNSNLTEKKKNIKHKTGTFEADTEAIWGGKEDQERTATEPSWENRGA